MPSYCYECGNCGEIEEFHSITIELTECPRCKENGVEAPVKKLISLCGKGIVELYGQDLVDKVLSDGQKLKREASQKESVYSNLIGEDHYHKIQTQMDRQRSERKHRR